MPGRLFVAEHISAQAERMRTETELTIVDSAEPGAGRPSNAVDRGDGMALVACEGVISPVGGLPRLICATVAPAPPRLRDAGCSHCPCHSCVGAEEPKTA